MGDWIREGGGVTDADARAIYFDSAAERYRPTYLQVDQDRLKTTFEIALPGKPDAFATYSEAGARRARK
jgi:hypothetical protein